MQQYTTKKIFVVNAVRKNKKATRFIIFFVFIIFVSFLVNNKNYDNYPGKIKFSVICQAQDSEYWKSFAQGAIDAANELDILVTVTGPFAETMVTEQIAIIETEISKKKDGLLIAANQPSSIKPVFEKAKIENIPILEVDVECDWEGRKGYVGAGNYEGGYKAGEWLNKHLKTNKKIAIIRGLLGDPTHDLRVRGCLDALKDLIEVVGIHVANSERGIAVGTMENILLANPTIGGVFCTNDDMALGAASAIEQNDGKILIVGFDGTLEALRSVKNGKLSATISCTGYEVAFLAVTTLYNMITTHEETQKRILLEPNCIDISNVDEYILDAESIHQKMR